MMYWRLAQVLVKETSNIIVTFKLTGLFLTVWTRRHFPVILCHLDGANSSAENLRARLAQKVGSHV
jgi:hypothetical protein